MSATDAPDTPATRAAADLGLRHEVRAFERPQGMADAAARIGVPLERLCKTLVVRRAEDDYLLLVLPGPRTLHWPSLRRALGVRRVHLPDADEARAATGYERGTITPLGAGDWPVLADASLAGAGQVSVGGGAHGVAIVADADELLAAVGAELADIARD